jgi:hypothetical protein
MECSRLTQVVKRRAGTEGHFWAPLNLVNRLMKCDIFENKKWKAARLMGCLPSFWAADLT